MLTIRAIVSAGIAVLLAVGLTLVVVGKDDQEGHLCSRTAASNPVSPSAQNIGDPLRAFSGEISAVAFAPDGVTVATGDEHLRLWDLITGQELSRADCSFDRCVDCQFLAFSPDGLRLVSVHRGCSPEGTSGQLMVFLWDVVGHQLRNPRELLAQYNRCHTPIYQASFSPDGKTLVAATADGMIYGWDTATGQKRFQFKGGVAACFSADGRTLATLTRAGRVRHWDSATGQSTDSDKENPETDFMYVARVAFAPRRDRAVVSDEYALILKDLHTGRTVWRVDLQGRQGCPLAFSPDGRILAVKVDDALWLLDGATGKGRSWCAHVRMGYRGVGAFSDDGHFLAVGEEKLLSIREVAGLLARGERIPPLPKTDPEGVPLEARLIAQQDTYPLNWGYRSAEEISNRFSDLPYPTSPRVNLVCVLRNVGSEPLTIPPETQLFDLYLFGSGAINLPPPGQTHVHCDGQSEAPDPVRLYPGESYCFPVTRLKAFSADRYWVAPGEYTLYASCHLSVSPAPKGASSSYDGSGWVTVRCAPLKFKVVENE
jgi:Tol biopolymer transport system component